MQSKNEPETAILERFLLWAIARDSEIRSGNDFFLDCSNLLFLFCSGTFSSRVRTRPRYNCRKILLGNYSCMNVSYSSDRIPGNELPFINNTYLTNKWDHHWEYLFPIPGAMQLLRTLCICDTAGIACPAEILRIIIIQIFKVMYRLAATALLNLSQDLS